MTQASCNWGPNGVYALSEFLPRFVKRLLRCWQKKLMDLTPWLPALQIGIPQDTEANVT